MGALRRDDRLLSKDEQELVARTRHPGIKQLSNDELLETIQHLRHSRNRTRAIMRSKGHELRSRTAVRGTITALDAEAEESAGHRAKRTLLSAALKRANKETGRRVAKGARSNPGGAPSQ